MTVLYPNPCYNEVCYKGTTLYTPNFEHLLLSNGTFHLYCVMPPKELCEAYSRGDKVQD